jgi:uncharacterized RDD family membrane protein YckC
VARRTGTSAAGGDGSFEDEPAAGSRLGLPPTGPGSVASLGARVGAYALDSVASALIAALFIPDAVDPRRGLLTVAVLVVDYLLLGTLTGQTFGMRLVGLRMVPVAAPDRLPGFTPVALRTALLVLLVPAVITDRDGRGLHDRAARTVVVRARG